MTTQQLSESSQAITARIFADLAEQWRLETAYLSDNGRAAANPNYRALIALGSRVVPYMLRDLQTQNPGQWFIALEEITGEDPIPEGQYGNIEQMSATWVEWGRRHGYIS